MQEKLCSPVEILTPQYISRQAFYTIPLFGITSLVAFLYDFQRISFCCFGVMLTSFAHWNLIKKEGMERNADRVFVILTYTSFWLDSQRFCPEYVRWWYPITLFSSGVYIVNQYVYYRIYESTRDPKVLEMNNYRSTYIHLFFIHILPNLAFIYGIITAGKCIA
jgi:hypothetical protein